MVDSVRQRRKRHEMNMTEGPILKKLIIYALPLIFTNILQLLFNATDIAVLGIFVDEDAVGAVGATSGIIGLATTLFFGLSSGASVVLSRAVGANDKEKAKRIVGTSIMVAIISGVILLLVGVLFARNFLIWMNCDVALLDSATKYLKIYFLGMPIMMVYNFSASVLRAVGDSNRPLYFLLIGGVVNVLLNVFCIVVLNMTVEGVAIATITAQFISATLCIIVSIRSDGFSKFEFKHFRIYKTELKDLIRIGIPSGIQSALFNLSNVIIYSTINLYGKAATTGNTVSAQFDGLVYTTGYAVALACMSFVSQNHGAGRIDRIRKVVWCSVFFATAASLTIGGTFMIFKRYLFGIMADDPDVLYYAYQKYSLLGCTYFLCSIMEVFSLSLRALGKSMTTMIISLFGACLFRILWLNTFYLLAPSYLMIFYAWPISWILTTAIYLSIYFPTIKKLLKVYSQKKAVEDNKR